MGDAGSPGRRRALLRADTGDADAFVLAELHCSVAGTADGGAQRVGETLGAAHILRLIAAGIRAGAVKQLQPHLDRVLTGRMGDVVHGAFDRPERPAGATERSWPDGVALLRKVVLEVADRVVRDRVPIVGAVDGKARSSCLSCPRKASGTPGSPVRGRPSADHVMLHGDGLPLASSPTFTFW